MLSPRSTVTDLPIATWMNRKGIDGLVSIVVPSYNCERFIGEAISSAVEQSYRPLELIVVDDGSIDATGQIVARRREALCNDQQIELRYLRTSHFGQPHALNVGLQDSRGEFIQYLDADDLLAPDKIELHVSALRSHADVEMVYGRTFVFREAVDEADPRFADYGDASEVTLEAMCHECAWTIMGPLYRRELTYRIGPWAEPLVRRVDWEYGMRALLEARGILRVPEAKTYYRRGHVYHRQRPPRHPPKVLHSYIVASSLVWQTLRRYGVADTRCANVLARWALRTALGYAEQGVQSGIAECLNFAESLPISRFRQLQVDAFRVFADVLGPQACSRLSRQLIAGKNRARHHNAA